jgi:ubiquinone/menaquinone biosynthesis C-methylase UbiE
MEWWENTAEYFQEDIGLDIGLNWTGFTVSELGLLDDVDGADVLELGCGGGQCTVALATRGANVTGIDLSEAQLSYARNLADEHDVNIDFRQGDVTDLGMFENNSYDIAFNAWVFQWVDDLLACFEETHRVLRPGGAFVFSMPHPFYNVVNPDTHTVEESYFDTGRHVIVDESTDANQVTYRHRVSDIHNALYDAGFDVEQMLEPGSSDPDDYEMGPWEEYTPELMSKLPSTLIFRARKEA